MKNSLDAMRNVLDGFVVSFCVYLVHGDVNRASCLDLTLYKGVERSL